MPIHGITLGGFYLKQKIMPHEMYLKKCKICDKSILTYFEFGLKKVYQKCKCKQLNNHSMRTEIKITDHLKREHLVSFNFTVRTNGYKCWKIYAEVRSNGEKFVVEYQETEKIISGLLSKEVSEQKADYLVKNMPVKETNLIYNWLSDFPRYKIVDAENGSLLCEERTREGAEEMAESFYFVNTLIVDTWSV